MGEMTAVEYFKKKNRMTKNCDIDCEDCPLAPENNPEKITCVRLESEFPEIAISIVQEWAEENPKKTILQDFLEKYPKAFLQKDGTPKVCPSTLGYRDIKGCISQECKDCWNRPMEE